MVVVYRDMKEGFMATDSDYGTRELREIFKGRRGPTGRETAR